MNIIALTPAQKTVLNFWINSVDPKEFGDLWAATKNERTGKYQLDLEFVGSVGFTDDKAYEINDKTVEFLVKLAHYHSGGLPSGMIYGFDNRYEIVLGAKYPSTATSVVMSLQHFIDWWLRD